MYCDFIVCLLVLLVVVVLMGIDYVWLYYDYLFVKEFGMW